MSDPKLLRFKKIHYFWIPIISLVVWWGMLIAMLSAWSLQGQPIYSFMNGIKQDPVYISDVGATNLQPLFISCAGFQAIFFVGTLIMEYYLRTARKLQPYVSSKQPSYAIVSVVCAIIGQLGIIFVSIFNTKNFHPVHISMVGVFIAFCFFACVFNFLNSFIFGNFPERLSPDHEKVRFGNHKWANLYMVSFFLKLFWLLCALVFAIAFGVYMKIGNNSRSAVFEWTISFWYGLLLVLWAIDLFPSAIKHYRSRHPELYPEQEYPLRPEKGDDELSVYGSPTYVNDRNQSYAREYQIEPKAYSQDSDIPPGGGNLEYATHPSSQINGGQSYQPTLMIDRNTNQIKPLAKDGSEYPSPELNRFSGAS